MRLFVAIELDEPFRNHLIKIQDSLRSLVPQSSFAKPQNLHLTLKFIGEHEEKEQQGERDNQDSCRDTLGQRQHGAEACPDQGPRRLRSTGDGPPLEPMSAVLLGRCALATTWRYGGL